MTHLFDTVRKLFPKAPQMTPAAEEVPAAAPAQPTEPPAPEDPKPAQVSKPEPPRRSEPYVPEQPPQREPLDPERMRRIVIRAIPPVVEHCRKVIPEQGTFKDFSLILDIPAQPYYGRIRVEPYKQEECAVYLAIHPRENAVYSISYLMFLGNREQMYEWFDDPQRIEEMVGDFAKLVIAADEKFS